MLNAGETFPLASPTLSADTAIATAGYFRLSWVVSGPGKLPRFELQESANADFLDPRTIYNGPDAATTFSGRSDGDYYFRVRSLESGQSSIGVRAKLVTRVEPA